MVKNELDTETLDWLVSKTNRSKSQTQELFNLCKGDLELLKQYEYNTKNCFLHYCAGDKKEMQKVLNMVPKKEYWSWNNGWN
jgi:hypothetical protein